MLLTNIYQNEKVYMIHVYLHNCNQEREVSLIKLFLILLRSVMWQEQQHNIAAQDICWT